MHEKSLEYKLKSLSGNMNNEQIMSQFVMLAHSCQKVDQNEEAWVSKAKFIEAEGADAERWRLVLTPTAGDFRRLLKTAIDPRAPRR